MKKGSYPETRNIAESIATIHNLQSTTFVEEEGGSSIDLPRRASTPRFAEQGVGTARGSERLICRMEYRAARIDRALCSTLPCEWCLLKKRNREVENFEEGEVERSQVWVSFSDLTLAR